MKVTINGNFALTSDDSQSMMDGVLKMLDNDKLYITETIKPDLISVAHTGRMSSGVSRGYEVKGEQSWFDFLKEWKEEGFWQAMYDRSFSEVMVDSFKEIFREIGLFIMGNADLFFLLPAILFLFATFFIGRNKYTKYVLPLTFGYFVATLIHKLLL